jgi:hypothetical protein
MSGISDLPNGLSSLTDKASTKSVARKGDAFGLIANALCLTK